LYTIPKSSPSISLNCRFTIPNAVIIFQQNKLTATFNKMITSGKSDWSYPPCWPPKWRACYSTSGPAFQLELNKCACWLNCGLHREIFIQSLWV